MKKILLLPVFFLLGIFASCSSDEDSDPKSVLTARINGTEYTFNTIHVDQVHYPAEGYTDLEVTASIDNNPIRTITFIVAENSLGTHVTWYFTYFLHQSPYQKVEEAFNIDVTENSGARLKGTFSGEVHDTESGETLTITDGTFNITY
ncbi:MAG TPA: hypothetical protein VGB50_10945 [Flavobacterium sp.]|jgi:hypothetical protein